MRDLCYGMVKIRKRRGAVPAVVVAERLSALGEEDNAVALKEEDREEYNTGSTLGTLKDTEEWDKGCGRVFSKLLRMQRHTPDYSHLR